jgi:Ala-tRNA(Pro) deacylase
MKLLSMTDVEKFLKSKQITYILHEHPAVYTCEEAEKYCGNIPGLACKNLFLRDKKKQRYFLLILPAQKRSDLKELAKIVGEEKITFASSEDLMEKLGLEPGSVSPFGVVNDIKSGVELYIDKEVSDAEIVSFHPNRNTATLELSQEMFRKFLDSVKNVSRVVDL